MGCPFADAISDISMRMPATADLPIVAYSRFLVEPESTHACSLGRQFR
jgi:hypothetical protein